MDHRGVKKSLLQILCDMLYASPSPMIEPYQLAMKFMKSGCNPEIIKCTHYVNCTTLISELCSGYFTEDLVCQILDYHIRTKRYGFLNYENNLNYIDLARKNLLYDVLDKTRRIYLEVISEMMDDVILRDMIVIITEFLV